MALSAAALTISVSGTESVWAASEGPGEGTLGSGEAGAGIWGIPRPSGGLTLGFDLFPRKESQAEAEAVGIRSAKFSSEVKIQKECALLHRQIARVLLFS